jgi:hypothetical protein
VSDEEPELVSFFSTWNFTFEDFCVFRFRRVRVFGAVRSFDVDEDDECEDECDAAEEVGAIPT